MVRKTMLEACDFEELDLDQCSLDETSTVGSDQHSKNESMATTSGLIDQAKTDQSKIGLVKTGKLKADLPEKLEFELSWDIRDEIISSLNQHTKLLSGLVINKEAREEIGQMNGDLIAELVSLPLKADGQLKSPKSLRRSPSNGPNEVALDLKWSDRLKIVNVLMTNHNIALLEGDSVTSACKSKLIDQNNDLICELVRLRSRTLPVLQHQPHWPPQIFRKTALNQPIGLPASSNSTVSGSKTIQESTIAPAATGQISHELRWQMIRKIVNSVLPSSDQNAQYNSYNALMELASKVENDFFKIAISINDYHRLLDEKCRQFEGEIEKNRKERKMQQRKLSQQNNQPMLDNQQEAANSASDPQSGISNSPSGMAPTLSGKILNRNLF